MNSINFDEIMTGLIAIGTCIMAIGTVALAIASIYGLRIWKKQLIGKDEYELAKRLLQAVNGVKFQIQVVRTVIYQIPSVDDTGEKRIELIKESLEKLQTEIKEAEILWGVEIHKIIHPLKNSAIKYIENLLIYINKKRAQEDQALALKIIFQQNFSEEDDFDKEVSLAVKKAEDFLGPFLKL